MASQRELEVAVALRKLGLLALVPTERRYRRMRGKNNRPEMIAYAHPIFSGYVFVGKAGPMPWAAIAKVRHCWGYVSFSEDGSPATLSDHDIQVIQHMTATVRASGGSLRIGEAIKIVAGAFANIEGVATAIGREKVKISVHVFGSERELVVPVGNVEKV